MWIQDIDLHVPLTVKHLQEFVTFWGQVREVVPDPSVDNQITRKFTVDGKYTATSAYKAQFVGSFTTNFQVLIWKT